MKKIKPRTNAKKIDDGRRLSPAEIRTLLQGRPGFQVNKNGTVRRVPETNRSPAPKPRSK